YRAVAQQVRKAEAPLCHLRWGAANAELAEAEHAKDAAVRMVAERTGEQAEASTRQAHAAADLPAMREAEANAAAALQRCTSARLARARAQCAHRLAACDRSARDARTRGDARQGTDGRTRPPPGPARR